MGDAHLARMGRWLAGVELAQVPERTRGAARAQLLDMAAALHAAARSGEVRCVLEGARAFASGVGRSTVLASGERRGPADAALTNAACSMAQDFDDIVWMGHPCHSAVFAALAVAQHEERSSGELLGAVIAANEIAGRLGASSFLGPLNGQMWTFIHLVGAAAATAKLLRLDEERSTHALAIALAQPNFALQPAFLKPSSKLLAAATPTGTGIQAAYFARAGMTGAPHLLEDSKGFWRRFSFLPLPGMLEGLGDSWVLDTLTVKTYPGCHYFQTALTALERLGERLGPLTLSRVREVRIEATKLACEVTRFAGGYEAGELTPVTVTFDLAQSAAVLLDAGRLGVDQLEVSHLYRRADSLREWLRRIRVAHDPALTAKVVWGARRIPAGRRALESISVKQLALLARRYASEYRSALLSWEDLAAALRGLGRADAPDEALGDGVPLYFPARVTVELADGRAESERVDLPVGSLASPGFAAELERKVLRELTRALGEAGAGRALELGSALEAHPLESVVAAFAVPS